MHDFSRPKNTSIYNVDSYGNPCPNRWGYRYNVNHPKIRELYEEYHRKIGVPYKIGLTTGHRLHFENMLDIMFEKMKEKEQKTE